MSENASLFIIENLEKSFEISRALDDVEEYFWPIIDTAIRDCLEEIFDDWKFSETDTLPDGECISIANKNLWFVNDNDQDSRIWVCFQAEGNEAFWDFFGLPTGSEKFIGMLFSMYGLKSLPNSEQKIKQIISLIDKPLKDAGFTVKGKIPLYKLPLTFSNKAILAAINDDNWEAVLKPVTDSAKVIYGLDWKKIISIVEEK